MIDRTGAEIVEGWLTRHGVDVRTGAQLQAIEDAGRRKRLRFQESDDLDGRSGHHGHGHSHQSRLAGRAPALHQSWHRGR